MTREEAIKRLEWLRMVGNHVDSVTLDKEDMPYFDMAIAALKEQNCCKKCNSWIPVTERLPKKITNKVLVYCKNGYIGFGHYEEFRGVTDWYNLENGKPFREWDLEDCETYEVTHWMPLPEPPEVEA